MYQWHVLCIMYHGNMCQRHGPDKGMQPYELPSPEGMAFGTISLLKGTYKRVAF